MDKLVKLIVAKTGIDEKMARQIVDVVVSHLKTTLPAPLNQNVEKLLGGEITNLSQIPGMQQGGLGGMLSGLFGGGRKK